MDTRRPPFTVQCRQHTSIAYYNCAQCVSARAVFAMINAEKNEVKNFYFVQKCCFMTCQLNRQHLTRWPKRSLEFDAVAYKKKVMWAFPYLEFCRWCFHKAFSCVWWRILYPNALSLDWAVSLLSSLMWRKLWVFTFRRSVWTNDTILRALFSVLPPWS